MPLRVTHFIDSLGPGGAQAQLLYVLQGLDRAQWQPDLAWYDRRPPFRPLPPDIVAEPIPRQGRLDRQFPQRIRQLLNPQRTDLVHAWLQGPSLYAGLAHALPRTVPLITSIRCSAAAFATDRVAGRMHLTGALLADRTLVNCRDVIPWLLARGVPSPAIVHLPNVLNPALEHRQPPDAQAKKTLLESLNLDPRTPPIVLLGRFDRYKNQDGLLRALGLLRAQGVNLPPILLAGEVEDPWRVQKVQQLADQHGLQVTIVPAVQDAANLLAAARLSVLCSHSEGSPNVVLEALAMGGLCVATRVGEVSDLILDNETSLIAAPGNDEALAQRIHIALELPPEVVRAMGERARADVRKRFSASVLIPRLQDLYADVVAHPRPAWQQQVRRKLHLS